MGWHSSRGVTVVGPDWPPAGAGDPTRSTGKGLASPSTPAASKESTGSTGSTGSELLQCEGRAERIVGDVGVVVVAIDDGVVGVVVGSGGVGVGGLILVAEAGTCGPSSACSGSGGEAAALVLRFLRRFLRPLRGPTAGATAANGSSSSSSSSSTGFSFFSPTFSFPM